MYQNSSKFCSRSEPWPIKKSSAGKSWIANANAVKNASSCVSKKLKPRPRPNGTRLHPAPPARGIRDSGMRKQRHGFSSCRFLRTEKFTASRLTCRGLWLFFTPAGSGGGFFQRVTEEIFPCPFMNINAPNAIRSLKNGTNTLMRMFAIPAPSAMARLSASFPTPPLCSRGGAGM